jgi:hypothetical protein
MQQWLCRPFYNRRLAQSLHLVVLASGDPSALAWRRCFCCCNQVYAGPALGGGGSSSAAALGPRDRGALPKYVHTSILHVYSLQARPKHITRPGKLKHRAADSSFPSLSHASRLASHGTVSPLPDCRRFISADLLRVSDDSRITIDTHAVK